MVVLEDLGSVVSSGSESDLSVLLEPEPTEPIHEHDYVSSVENKGNILPAEIYFENGKLMVTVYIANNTDHNVTGLSVQKNASV